MPFVKENTPDRGYFLLRVCKGCRAEWLEAIEKWFTSYEKKPEVGSGLWIRRKGATVEVTPEELEKQNFS